MQALTRSLHCARPHDAASARRTYITPRLLAALQRSPVVGQATKAFGFQGPGLCLPHSAGLLARIVGGLEGQGSLKKEPPSLLARTVRALMVPQSEGLIPLEVPRDAKGLRALTDEVGPVQLVTVGTLQPQQGASVYDTFHATVLLATHAHEGRSVGVLLDANDLQDNPVMKALRAWQAAAGDSRPLEALTTADFEAFNRAHPGLDLYQAALRTVDLDDMLAASRDAVARMTRMGFTPSNPVLPPPFEMGTTVLGVADTVAVAPLIAPDARQALSEALRAQPQQIERFTRE